MPAKGYRKPGAKPRSVRQRGYQGSAKQKKRRAARNRIRRKSNRTGRTRKGDGKEIDHLNRRSLTGKTRVVSRSVNRRKNSPLWRRRKRRR